MLTKEQIDEVLARPTMTIPEAGEILGFGLSTARRLVHEGHIPSIRMGWKFVVPTAPIRHMLETGRHWLPEDQQPKRPPRRPSKSAKPERLSAGGA